MTLRIIVIFVGIAFGFLVYQVSTFYSPVARISNGSKIVLIPKGAALPKIAETLKDHGIIRSAWKFKLLARIKGSHRKLQPGEYELLLSSSPNQALKVL